VILRGIAARRPAQTKNPCFLKGLASFDAAVDCAAANNRLKRRKVGSNRSEFGFAPEFAFTISNQDNFLDAKRAAIRVRKMLCHRAASRDGESGKR
jgi:hypothetical protein